MKSPTLGGTGDRGGKAEYPFDTAVLRAGVERNTHLRAGVTMPRLSFYALLLL